jgi:hypothetical protein
MAFKMTSVENDYKQRLTITIEIYLEITQMAVIHACKAVYMNFLGIEFNIGQIILQSSQGLITNIKHSFHLNKNGDSFDSSKLVSF